jgi:alpha-L-arabinofuranosidase
MVSRNYQPLCVPTEVRSPGNSLDVAATRSEDGKTLTVQVVNTGKAALVARLRLEGFVPRRSTAHTTVLAGDWEAINTPEQPGHIMPSESDWPYELMDGVVSRTLPAYSFTVLQFR